MSLKKKGEYYTHIGGLLYCCEVLSGFHNTDDVSDSPVFITQFFTNVPAWTTGGCVAESEQKTSRKFYFSFKYSVPFQSSARRGAHRSAIMWFQCLGPCGIVPSGGKPLRLCWHITAAIINSRSALSFLLHLSSFPPFCTVLLLCLCSHLCPWLLHLYSPSTLFF